ncbi:MAG: hypothetical protein JWQ88_647 [Rhodoferax sp.]|nr:hypothetical protein [Rhodoferax sp.]
MKKIDLSVVVSEALFQRWQSLPASCNADVNAALLDCLERLCEAHARNATPHPDRRALPQMGQSDWGQAWSRRWTDFEAQRYARKTGDDVVPPPDAT